MAWGNNTPMSMPDGTTNVPPEVIQQMLQQRAMQQQMAQQASAMPTADSPEIARAKMEAEVIATKFKAMRDSGIFDKPKVGMMDRIGSALFAGGDSLLGTNNYTNKMDNQAIMYKQQMDMAQQMMKQDEIDPMKQYTLGLREDQYKNKRITDMGNDLDWNKNVRSAYGVTAQGFHRAERIEGLVNQYKDLNLDTREMSELAIGLNAMLQGSNQSAQKQVAELIPKSAIGNVQKLQEWLTNEPKGLNQQKFVQRMLNDVKREKEVMQKQLLRDARAKLSKYPDVEKNYPQEWGEMLQSWGIDAEEYKAWRASGYKSDFFKSPSDVDNGKLKTSSGVEFSYKKL